MNELKEMLDQKNIEYDSLLEHYKDLEHHFV